MKREIIQTADGSKTIYLPDIDEHYHSVNGAIGESMHVFVEAGFKFCKADPATVFEVGFGTGLNAFLTAIEAGKNRKHTRYSAIEKFPLPHEVIAQLDYQKLIGGDAEDIFSSIHSSEWGRTTRITEFFELEKTEGDIITDEINCLANVVYFDAFAYSKQSEIWQYDVLEKVCSTLNTGGIFVTYSARGELKRNLRTLGFEIIPLPGASGKREMIRAIKL
jgi:tRNA U34 5-methylaminomethyl-2-thiouridine-forming methyltransferase MnmC